MSVNRFARTLAAATVVAGLVLASCSEDPNDAVTPTAPSGGDTSTTTAATTPLPMGDIVATALTNHVFTELAGLVVDAGLVEALRGGPFTVFAPTDAAFDKLPVDILHAVQDFDAEGDGKKELIETVLLHHVVKGAIGPDQLAEGSLETLAGTTLKVSKVGDQFYVEGNPVGAGVEATNGWVYVMSDVLVPAIGDIVAVATTLPGFGTLADLVTKAGLVETLQGKGPFTVFAPLDSAFAALPAATLAAVLADPALLSTVLTYHVLPGEYTIDQLQPGTYTTVAGVDITVTVDENGTTFVDGNPILVQNVRATNGVIHVIGGVLVPQG
ncbi:MAG: fasciclin domain-containing protein [Ilumatobacteraceae bacterium]